MPRTTSAPIDTGIAAHITEPVYLVEVRLPTALYWTTWSQLTWNTITWQPVAMRVLALRESGARLELRNDDNSGSSLALNNTLRDTEFRIYLYYNGDAVEIFRGYGSDIRVAKNEITVDLELDRARNTLAPRGRIAAPTFTHRPRLGDVIRLGTEVYKVTY